MYHASHHTANPMARPLFARVCYSLQNIIDGSLGSQLAWDFGSPSGDTEGLGMQPSRFAIGRGEHESQ